MLQSLSKLLETADVTLCEGVEVENIVWVRNKMVLILADEEEWDCYEQQVELDSSGSCSAQVYIRHTDPKEQPADTVQLVFRMYRQITAEDLCSV